MTLIDGLRSSPAFLLFSVFLLGLCIGSFLNVVIHRLPKMMERAWRREARELLELPEIQEHPLSLARPGSHCPSCSVAIKPWHNLPLIGWLWLRGRCAACQAPISIRYPLIELAAGLLGAICVWRFGYGLPLIGGLLLCWTLLALAMIDADTQLLPDSLTLPLLWIGIGFGLWDVYVPLQASVIGAIAGYLSLWSVFHLFRLITGKEGMGYGDFKLLAALGAWLGWQALPTVILLSSVVGAVIGITLVVFRQHDRQQPLPFGPYLAGAGMLSLLWGDVVTRAYLNLIAG